MGTRRCIFLGSYGKKNCDQEPCNFDSCPSSSVPCLASLECDRSKYERGRLRLHGWRVVLAHSDSGIDGANPPDRPLFPAQFDRWAAYPRARRRFVASSAGVAVYRHPGCFHAVEHVHDHRCARRFWGRELRFFYVEYQFVLPDQPTGARSRSECWVGQPRCQHSATGNPDDRWCRYRW